MGLLYYLFNFLLTYNDFRIKCFFKRLLRKGEEKNYKEGRAEDII